MAANPKTTSYAVLKRLRHDGGNLGPGDQVDLTDDQAKALLKLGCVAPAPVAQPTKNPAPAS